MCPDFPKDAIKYSQIMRSANEKNDLIASCSSGKKMMEALQGYRPCSKEASETISTMAEAIQGVCKQSEALQKFQEQARKFSNDANCPGFLQARTKCATAGNYKNCMNILFPEFPYKYADLEMLCPFTR